MPKFEYTALNSSGKELSGLIDAKSDNDAIQNLRTQGLFPTKVNEEGKGTSILSASKARTARRSKGKLKTKAKKSGARVNAKSLMIFTRQLATLIEAGLPLMRGLTVLAKQEPNKVLKSTITNLSDSVQSGNTFSESLAGHPKIFSKLFINMVKAGELGGVLEIVLQRLAEYQEKANKLKNKIIAAMVYPTIVMVISIGIVIFLLTFIVPKFEKIFTDMLGSADALPGLTKFVVALSRGIANNAIWEILGIGLLVFGYIVLKSSKFGKRIIDTIKLKMPLFGSLQQKSAISRFSRTLGTLVTSGVPILQALNITKETADNIVLEDAIEKIHNAVKEGESIVAPMEASKMFPPMVISMVDVGEETGQLPEMLVKVAEVYDDEVDNAVEALTSVLEPIMIVMLAGVVGTIVAALFLPLIKIISDVGSKA